MAIRILTLADAAAIQSTLTELAPAATVESLFAPLPAGHRQIVIGDPPVFCRLLHYQITSAQQISLFPASLAAALTASNGWCSQLTHTGPFSASDATISARVLPHLATALAAIVSKAPSNIRTTLRNRPVWACFDGVSAADARALVAQMKAVFPLAETADNIIWMPTLQGAADAVASLAVIV